MQAQRFQTRGNRYKPGSNGRTKTSFGFRVQSGPQTRNGRADPFQCGKHQRPAALYTQLYQLFH
uniref:Uncharacterized protein n=1 Tax=Anguilla anguilla TaxID=7936 RepID=A0A0E9TFL0_ANGAN